MEDEEELERNEVDSDLESTASSKPVWKKTTKADPDRASRGLASMITWIIVDALHKMAPTRRSGPNNNENPDIAAIIAQQLQTILPLIVTHVTNNMNNANGGNGRNEEFCPSNEIEKLESEFWNHKMVGANHAGYTDQFHELAKLVSHLVTPESSRIKRAGILTDKAVSCGTLTKGNDKRKVVEESSKSGGSWKDNKKAKVGTGFVATAPPSNEFVSSNPKCGKCFAYHPANESCKLCFNCQKPGYLIKDCQATISQATPVRAVRTSNNMYQGFGQPSNQLAFEGNRNNRSNGNQVRGRAFNVNVNAMEAVQDPNVVTGMFSLNDHFVTVLFDYGADFSFISTEFAPLLNVKPSIANPGYVIEVADGKKVKVDSIFRDCKLELGSSLCHEKVVEIPVEDGRTLRVHGERIVGISKALKSAKEDEPKLGDISVVRDFEDVFPKDLTGLPPQ
ncbi:putative reverse transcriptase domain-containing protein [Tanacetum coccineum]